ncbi:MAG: helix-turn-helix transcriptional regulator [Lachnospiraceae bacterium]|nr:helix-turn-helix transcriptional regulator [Lachnospiraceae bacterium]
MDDFMARQILNELTQIRKMLTIMSQDKLESFNDSINKRFLTTEQRRQMYELFDGENSYKTIADTVSISSEGVRKFAVQLEQAGLVELVPVGKTKNPKRVF